MIRKWLVVVMGNGMHSCVNHATIGLIMLLSGSGTGRGHSGNYEMIRTICMAKKGAATLTESV